MSLQIKITAIQREKSINTLLLKINCLEVFLRYFFRLFLWLKDTSEAYDPDGENKHQLLCSYIKFK
jgi:hypothetical protein